MDRRERGDSRTLKRAVPGLSEQAVRAEYESVRREDVWINDIYQVNVNKNPNHGFANVNVWHLSIKRHDKKPVHDWRDLQQIKNELCGEECEAIELYPAESRLVDAANQYHLFAFVSSGFRLPVGFQDRMVLNEIPGTNTKQRSRV